MSKWGNRFKKWFFSEDRSWNAAGVEHHFACRAPARADA